MNDDQDIELENLFLKVKEVSVDIHTAINNNDLPLLLNKAYIMLSELRTSSLNPKYYNRLYNEVYDEMQFIQNFIKNSTYSGRKPKRLYEAAQQASFLIPRLFLQIVTGVVYIETEPRMCCDIMFDLIQMIKGVQHPIRGFFTRYFLLKTIKDVLPDKGNKYESSNISFEDSLSFLFENLEEMNTLWIRIASDAKHLNKPIQVTNKERLDVKHLLGENIIKIASMKGMTFDIYTKVVLPRMKDIIINCKDSISQHFLLECLVTSFPIKYLLMSIEKIVDIIAQMVNEVDTKSLYILIMDKLLKYIKEEKISIDLSTSIYSIIRTNVNSAIEKGGEKAKMIELFLSYMKFTLHYCPVNEIMNAIHHILICCLSTLTKNDVKLPKEGLKNLNAILVSLFEAKIKMFHLEEFPKIMFNLNYNQRSALSLLIIDYIIKGIETLDTKEKLLHVISLIRTLIEDSPDADEFDEYQFEYEQSNVGRMIYMIKEKNPYQLFNLYVEMSKILAKGGFKRQRYTLPCLVNNIMLLCYKVSYLYNYKNIDSNQTRIHKDFIESIDISFITNEEDLIDLMRKGYCLINQLIAGLSNEYPKLALNLLLTVAINIHSIKDNKLDDIIVSFLGSVLLLFKQGNFSPEVSTELLNHIMSSLSVFSSLDKNYLSVILSLIESYITETSNKEIQCNQYLILSYLYFSLFNDKDKIILYLDKAVEVASQEESNNNKIFLFVSIINKVIYYIEKGINIDKINGLTTQINNLLKEEKSPDETIVSYYNSTNELIKNKKESDKKELYKGINV